MNNSHSNEPDKIRIFFDISAIVEYSTNFNSFSGIQRVVAEIIPRFADFHKRELLFVSWLDKKSQDYKCLPFTHIDLRCLENPIKLREHFLGIPTQKGQKYPLARYASKPIRHLFYRTKLDLGLATRQKKPFRRFGITPQDWKRLRKNAKSLRASQDLASRGKKIQSISAPGDRLVVLDSSWREGHATAFTSAKNLGLKVYIMVHDMIPILYPQTTSGFTPQVFAKWLTRSVNYTSTYLANSENTRHSILKGSCTRMDTASLLNQFP